MIELGEEWIIYCDNDDCNASATADGNLSVSDAYRVFYDLGWMMQGRFHDCPGCVVKAVEGK